MGYQQYRGEMMWSRRSQVLRMLAGNSSLSGNAKDKIAAVAVVLDIRLDDTSDILSPERT